MQRTKNWAANVCLDIIIVSFLFYNTFYTLSSNKAKTSIALLPLNLSIKSNDRFGKCICGKLNMPDFYEARLYGFGELAFGGVGVLIPRMPSPSQMYLPTKKKKGFKMSNSISLNQIRFDLLLR